MSDVLEIYSLTKIYGKQIKTTALAGIDLKVKKGEFIALTGESGCGKTTLLNLVAGLDYPTSGNIVLDGVDITSLSDQQLAMIRRNKIGFVFQFFNLIPTLTAAENIEVAMMIAKKSEEEQHRRAKELLEIVGLSDKLKSKPNELSGGEQQRVAIARALANNSTLILMDEPTGNLDSKTSKDIMRYIRKLNQQGNTIIMATHDPLLAKDADRIICLQDGKIKN